jgi:hypothetical protein
MQKVKSYSKTIAIVVFTVIGTKMLMWGLESIPSPHLALDQQHIKMDTLIDQSDATRYVTYTNTGNSKLKILGIDTSCGCTVTNYSSEALAPGRKDSFKISYDIANKGFFFKEILIYSNSPSSPDRIYIDGFVPY